MQITDSIEIKTAPENIFQWFMNIENNYQSWHPDHVGLRWIKGKAGEIGSIAVAKEYLHGKLHNMKLKTIAVEKNVLIEYKNYFPISIITPKGSFQFAATDFGCVFTATVSFRFGTLLSKIFRRQVEVVIKHMREEGENMKRILEG